MGNLGIRGAGGKTHRKVSPMRVGLTGGVASGKSTVSAMLDDLGAVVIDADALAREVVEPGTPGLGAVVAEFGAEVLTDDGRLDRAKLGALVFADRTRRAALEAIVHPLVRARAAEIEEAAPAGVLVVHDIPLLVETGQPASFDAVVVVDVPEKVQVERAVRERGWTEDEARARVAAQASRSDRLAAATHVVENSGTIEDLRQRVAEVFEKLVRMETTS
jgi:dephospho-CoA kinase